MSYEGYTQMLCAKGHLTHKDAFADDLEGFRYKCCRVDGCGQDFVWQHEVDQTNDDGFAVKLVQKSPAKYSNCYHCGNKELIDEKTFHVPTEEEVENQRKVYEENNHFSEGSS